MLDIKGFCGWATSKYIRLATKVEPIWRAFVLKRPLKGYFCAPFNTTMDLSKRHWQWLLLVFLAFVWGSSFILMKKALLTFTDVQVGAFRMFVAFAVLLPYIIPNLKHLKGKAIFAFIAVGLFGNGIPAFLFAKAQTVVDSALAGMLNSLVALFTLLLGLVFFKIKTHWLQIAGVTLGLVGAIALILASAGGVNGPGENWAYSLLIVLASFCYAISVNVIKQHLQGYGAGAITGLALLFVGPITGIYVFGFTDFTDRLVNAEAYTHLGYLILLAVVGTALAVLLFNMLISKTTALFASAVTYLIPGVAMFWGVLDGESIGWQQLLGIGVILLGIRLIREKKAPSSS